MMTLNLFARCAPVAIAASAALYTVPAVAQDAATAAPVIVLPEPAPVATAAAPAPAAPAPAIAVPQTTAAPEPVVASEPEIAAPVAAQTTARREAPRATTRETAARAIVTAPAASTRAPVAPAAANTVTDAAPAAPAVSPVAVAPVVTKPATQPPVAARTADNTGEIALAGLLGALGLAVVGGVAFAASRRRRRNADAEYETVEYEQIADEGVIEPLAVADPVVPVSTPVPSFTAPAPVASAFTAPVVAAPAARSAPTRVSGDPIALPREAPQTFEERDALLKELVAAEPDKANPFVSPRARARRAKLIMQSLAHSFENRKPRFDLSEYTNRWPALRGWQPATA